MKNLFLHIFFSVFISLKICAQTETNSTKYVAGTPISLFFKKETTIPKAMYCSNSYGSILITPTTKENNIEYVFPEQITQQSGWVHWTFIGQQNKEGDFYIHPTKNATHIETYLGPPSIETSDKNYAMLVVIPFDEYNNPVAKNTPIEVNKKHFKTTSKDEILFNGMIGYKYILGSTKAGRTFISTKCLGLDSKEYTLEITPNIPTNFNIFSSRVHEYGDGNQILKLNTSTIKDKYNNTVADGTFVTFHIQNKAGMFLTTHGNTINGVATAQMIHPEHQDTYTITAEVNNLCESNTLKIDFKNAILDYKINYSDLNKTVTIGPFKSFMNQLLPDGLFVNLKLVNSKGNIDNFSLQTEHGYATVNLKTYLEVNQTYVLKVNAAEIDKEIKIINK